VRLPQNYTDRPTRRHNGQVTTPSSAIDQLALDDVVELTRQLIQIDTCNFGDGSGPGEAAAAEYVEDSLSGTGFAIERLHTTSGKRQAVIVKIPGTNPNRPGLLVHAHLDTVPAIAADWSVPPLGAEVVDDMIWGRGAVDMKDSVAMTLAIARSWARTETRPERDITLAFVPDEEAGGVHGAHWLVDNRPDLFEGITDCVGEVGGFSFTVNNDLRLYTVQTAEKGLEWMRLRASGRAGHGSMVHDDNAVTALSAAVTNIGQHKWPIVITPTVKAMIDSLSDVLGIDFDANDPEQLTKSLGSFAAIVGAVLQNTANPTQLQAGYKANVIPGTAEAVIDGRYLPGQREEFLATIDSLIGEAITREVVHSDISVETEFDGPLVDLMASVLREVDPGARTIPYTLSAGTDAKSFSSLGMRCFGFMPLRLPPELNFAGLFHGVDERVPISSLHFGVDVLGRLLQRA